jgi:hypothetical protein
VGVAKSAERARFTQRRKDIYIALHPETRHGGERASRQVGDLQTETNRFTADTAVKTGQSERTVQRDAIQVTGESVRFNEIMRDYRTFA